MSSMLSVIVRKAGFIKFADKIRYDVLLLKSTRQRKEFKRNNPGVILPPPYFLYETFNLNYSGFYNKSIDTAKWLIGYFEKYKNLEDINILDWGCGPGRVIRHLPTYIQNPCNYFGTDYNKKYIKWCSRNLTKINFSLNKLYPPLEYQSNFFDVIYGISIFTHLSEKMHYAWFKELVRIMKPGGILFLTLHGGAFIDKLTDYEKKHFKNGDLVVKGNTKEGHRTFGAFQPASFVKELVGKNAILEHIAGKVIEGKPQQDIWIIQKTKP